MKLLSWNVAGFRACLKKGFTDFFDTIDADIFCLQEVKALPQEIPFTPTGYICYQNVAEKKGYSGTLIYTKIKPISIQYGMNIEKHDHEGRLITLEFPTFYLINTYVPNVKRDLSRMIDRMDWEDQFVQYVDILEKTKPVVICGDFNVAHQEIDIKNPKQNEGNAGFTKEERQKFSDLLNHGLCDTFRFRYPEQKDRYSWWSYRKGVRERNIGWRIDYFLVSNSLKENILDAKIHSNILGSDHCPIELDLSI